MQNASNEYHNISFWGEIRKIQYWSYDYLWLLHYSVGMAILLLGQCLAVAVQIFHTVRGTIRDTFSQTFDWVEVFCPVNPLGSCQACWTTCSYAKNAWGVANSVEWIDAMFCSIWFGDIYHSSWKRCFFRSKSIYIFLISPLKHVVGIH